MKIRSGFVSNSSSSSFVLWAETEFFEEILKTLPEEKRTVLKAYLGDNECIFGKNLTKLHIIQSCEDYAPCEINELFDKLKEEKNFELADELSEFIWNIPDFVRESLTKSSKGHLEHITNF